MENLNLAAIGCHEMNSEENIDFNGGVLWIPVVIGALLIDSMINSDEYSQSMMDGWNDARNN